MIRGSAVSVTVKKPKPMYFRKTEKTDIINGFGIGVFVRYFHYTVIMHV